MSFYAHYNFVSLLFSSVFLLNIVEQDVEEESGDGRKEAGPSRTGLGSKRSRSAEVHNLSERRRRDRINEKMRALQELIPNCNKVSFFSFTNTIHDSFLFER
jgi:hypothetical protein